MNELRKNVWNEAVRSAIKTYANMHPDIGLPYELHCFGTHAIDSSVEIKDEQLTVQCISPLLCCSSALQ
jgi:hypothetical protein